ncbi:MAG: GNAT family N-acetyltransferase [Deinococcales bacterium]
MTKERSSPILLDFPEALETERLIVRAPRWGDGAAVGAAVRESLDELRPWLSWAQAATSLEEDEAICRRARLRFLERSDLAFYLTLKEDGAFVGGSGLHRIDWEARKFEIGYWVRTRCRGMGYVTEAVEGITRFAVERLRANRIEIRCDARNTRSARVAERAGFTLEGTLRAARMGVDGTLTDTRVYAKVRGHEF